MESDVFFGINITSDSTFVFISVRPRSCLTSQSPTFPSSPISSRLRCLPPSSTTKLCPSGKKRSRCFASLMPALTKRACTMSGPPAWDRPTTRGAPSSRNLVSPEVEVWVLGCVWVRAVVSWSTGQFIGLFWKHCCISSSQISAWSWQFQERQKLSVCEVEAGLCMCDSLAALGRCRFEIATLLGSETQSAGNWIGLDPY